MSQERGASERGTVDVDRSGLRAGDVLRYTPRRHHCKEGTAFVRDDGRVLDTYWKTYGDTEYGLLNEQEIASSEVHFNVNDYDALDEYSRDSRPTWETYHPDNRGRISSQHGLQEALFVRSGAAPDLETQIANAQTKVEEAESKLRSALHRLKWCREDLAKLKREALDA